MGLPQTSPCLLIFLCINLQLGTPKLASGDNKNFKLLSFLSRGLKLISWRGSQNILSPLRHLLGTCDLSLISVARLCWKRSLFYSKSSSLEILDCFSVFSLHTNLSNSGVETPPQTSSFF